MLNVKKTLTKIITAITPAVKSIVLNGYFKNLTGGVFKIGRLYLVNMTVYTDGTFAANDYYTVASGLPAPNVMSALTVTTGPNEGSRGAVASVNSSGDLIVQSGANALTNYTLYITGIYLGGGVLLNRIIPSPCRKVVGVC